MKSNKRVIYKYKLAYSRTVVEMPANAKILTLQVQDGEPHIWCEVDPEEETVVRYFNIYGTGQEIASEAKYVGTYQELPYGWVWHAYEEQS